MDDVKSFNETTFEMNQKARDERMRKVLADIPNTHEHWSVNVKKSMEEVILSIGKWKPKILRLEPVESDASCTSAGTGAKAIW